MCSNKLCVFFFFIQEFSVLQINTEGQIKVLETDLQAARATLAALKDRNKDLGKIYDYISIYYICRMCRWTNYGCYLSLEDLHQVTKSQNEDLENENARLHGEFSFGFFTKSVELNWKANEHFHHLWLGNNISKQVASPLLCFFLMVAFSASCDTGAQGGDPCSAGIPGCNQWWKPGIN